MRNEEIKKQIENLHNELKAKLEGYPLDFANEHYATDSQYWTDAITEFADLNTSIYYSEQEAYYNEHSEECEYSLLATYDGEFIAKYIKENGLNRLICLAGAMGEFEAIEKVLYYNADEIIQYLACEYVLDHFKEIKNKKDILEKIKSLDSNNIDRIYDILKVFETEDR